MTPRELLIRHEAIRLKPYKDKLGILTIGCGRNLDDNGISMDEALFMLDADIAKAYNACGAYPWFKQLSDAREAAMINLMFNMGPKRLAGFVRFLKAMSQSDWKLAADELVASKWYTQVGRRGPEIFNLIMKEEWPK